MALIIHQGERTMMFSDRNQSSLKVEKQQKMHHPLLRPLINFWKFSCYYADYKARIWDVK
ncbi:hypothetical protein B1A85_11790 [Chroococcidiopsis sp. TS-821]|nr:hypothetical protein B1A85_11790 [Chroococcidiopsis sp. TS-821]